MNKILLFFVFLLFLTGCSSVDFPQKQPLTDQERETLTCTDIQTDITQTQEILDALNSGNVQAATGAAVGGTALLAAMGGVSFDLIGTPIAHARAINATKTRLDQLHELETHKACEQQQQPPAQSSEPDSSVNEANAY